MDINLSYKNEVLPIFETELYNNNTSKVVRALFATGADEVLWNGDMHDLDNIAIEKCSDIYIVNMSIKDMDNTGTMFIENLPIRQGYHPFACDAKYDIVIPGQFLMQFGFSICGPDRLFTIAAPDELREFEIKEAGKVYNVKTYAERNDKGTVSNIFG